MSQTGRVRDRIYAQLLAGALAPGDPVASEREMAGRMAVSRVTVRKAYADLVGAGILKKFRGKAGTRVSDDFRGHAGTSPLVAVVATLANPFTRCFIEALQAHALEHDLLAVLAATPEDPAQQAAMAARMVARGVGNLVLWGLARDADDGLYARMRILGVNLVFFDRVKPWGPFADFVALDNRHAMKTLFEAAGLDDASGAGSAARTICGLDLADVVADSNRERRQALDVLARRRGLAVDWRLLPAREDAKRDARLLAAWRGGRAPVFAINGELGMRARRALGPSRRVYCVDGSPEAGESGIVGYAQPIDRMASMVVASLLRQREAPDWRAGELRARGTLVLPEKARKARAKGS